MTNEFPMCDGKPHFPICTYNPKEAHLEAAHFTEPQPIACKWCGAKDIKKYGTRKEV
ncbi:MAG: hypothetical protein HYX79_02135, partial [Chloroflexi bacterium]|nr:hypothetical protein [Chloroflexota bacterium]